MDDKDKKKRPYKDFEDFINKIMEEFFTRPVMLPNIFEEFDRMIRQLAEEFSLFPQQPSMPLDKKSKTRSYTWGFSIVIPPTGQPKIYRFGNVKPEVSRGRKIEIEKTEEFEPLASVYEEDSKVKVVVDLPGVDEDSINIDASESKVIIRAKGEDRKYYKEIELPRKVDPNSVKVSYRNGVLELEFEKK